MERAAVEHTQLTLAGLDCPDCAVTIERGVAQLPGVVHAAASFAASTLHAEFRRGEVSEVAIRRRVEQLGYRVVTEPALERAGLGGLGAREVLTLVSGAFLLAGAAAQWLGAPYPWAVAAFAAAIAAGGWHVGRAGALALWTRRLDMNLLMAVGAIGAAAIGEWAEGATIVFLFGLGNAIEAHTVERARRSVRALMQLAPDAVRVNTPAGLRETPLAAVRVGDLVSLPPGQRVPLDGVVTRGATDIDEATLTGESRPVPKAAGDAVFAGTLNHLGAIEFRVTKPAGESTMSQVIRLIERAQSQKAPQQRTIDRFAAVYTPIVIILAAVVAVALPLLGWAPWLDAAAPPNGSVYRALALLVLACPCALVISTPVAIISGLVAAARMGVLIKGGAFLEQAGRLTTIAFDKTGTITRGRQEVVAVVPVAGQSEDALLALAAGLEQHSEHPLGRAVAHAAHHRGVAPRAVEGFRALPGLGVRAGVDGVPHCAGNARLLADHGIDLGAASADIAAAEAEGDTVVLVADRSRLLGYLRLRDVPRPEAAPALHALKALGIERLCLVTGDHAQAARRVADALPFDEVQTGLLPDQKIDFVRGLVQRYGDTAMVGDGVNDAPALAASNLGIAMGSIGSDAALETADVALMTDDLSRLPLLVRHGRAVLRLIAQNIAFSLLVKGALLLLVFNGTLTLWLAVAGDMGTSLLVTLNGLRALHAPR